MPVLSAPTRAPVSHGWLRSRGFDLTLVVATIGVALAAGAAVSYDRRLLAGVLFLDVWLLGNHHVVSTFTRLAMDAQSRKQYRFLLLHAPLLVISAVGALYIGIGAWAIVALYFYWQAFHYARQSWGVAQMYRRSAGEQMPREHPLLVQSSFFALPLYAVLHRSAQGPTRFLGMPLRALPVSNLALHVSGAFALAGVLWFVVSRVQLWRKGALPVAHTLYVLTHYTILYIGYVAIENIDAGWVTVNIWHNAQYVLFVWMFNNRRFEARADPRARFLSYVSQRKNVLLYFASCLGLSLLFYAPVAVWSKAMPYLAFAYPIVNFHHYIADAIIWRRKGRAINPVRAAA